MKFHKKLGCFGFNYIILFVSYMAMQPLRLVKFEALYEVLINEICGIMKINFKGDGSRRLASMEVFRFDELKIYAADEGFFHVYSTFMHSDLFYK